MIPYFDPAFYPQQFVAMNEQNRLRCVASVYDNPSISAESDLMALAKSSKMTNALTRSDRLPMPSSWTALPIYRFNFTV
ncbi:unnamed protein product [Nippostrongylus brasiliensis]|uniref:Uncharacterized protein n=1 Tax=Nippostrongylus brasiliensis TaxID=27835 RepID=A0A0N4YGV3_NIPBR|nr:unnamed protein product [Nippostrongylus brasiliensis]